MSSVETVLSGRRIEVRGIVQGVGFRPWVYRLAREEGVGGRVRNDTTGVEIEVFGPEGALETFVERLRTSPPPAAWIRDIECQPIPGEAVEEFVIVPSAEGEGERKVSIPPDLATCPDCQREIFDPRDRRYRYPFTNCTNCGPRFTIAREIPYDRAATTMAGFEMCPRCRAEYEQVENRRFHAQPNACPACGPRLWAVNPWGEVLDGHDPFAIASLCLENGKIVAVKGIGGFHLACDATSGRAVERLRQRKHRDAKPFAVMVPDLAAVERIAETSEAERRLLTSIERPIVLLRRRPEGPLAAEVAPDNPLVGVLLPYSPLHHLLLDEVGRPLVMTSGNLSEEPIVRGNEEALERLGGIADLFLLHDRAIESRCDDSVARVIAGAPTVLRRSRGYVPRPIPLARPFALPVLACGGHLKNTVCLGAGDTAYLGPHVGDLESAETVLSYKESIARLEQLVGIRPEVVAYDLHPSYLSTAYALEERPEPLKVGVQHHHAHVASAMAEHGLDGPVLGVAFDGTGFGTDGTAWGGEFLVADYGGYERIATFRAMPLAGSDLAIREVWRLALAVVDDAFDGEPPMEALPLFRDLGASGPDARTISVVRRMIATGLNTPYGRGVGRWFDALGSLVLARPFSRYEGEVAMHWNLVAEAGERGEYPILIDFAEGPPLPPGPSPLPLSRGERGKEAKEEKEAGKKEAGKERILEIDPRPMVRGVVADLGAGVSPGVISAKFHNTIAAAVAEVARASRAAHGDLPVVLTGGCFQNALLAERTVEALTGGPPVYLHREVPPGDGGLALGQAMVADAMVRQDLLINEEGGI